MNGPPARIIVTDDLRRSRVTVFFRLLLFIPHLVWLALWSFVAAIVAIVNWVATLVTGTPPAALYEFLSAYLRYTVHANAFLVLAANPFPGFTGKPGTYPIDVEIAPRERQPRLTTLFRLILAIPVFLVASVVHGSAGGAASGSRTSGVAALVNVATAGVWLGGMLFVLAFLGWFAALVGGRMPPGLRNALAWGLGYSAQVTAYTLVLTARYPNTDPGATGVLGVPPPHPIRVSIEDDLRRSRVTVFFRLFLFIPHYVWLALWGIAVELAVLVSWVVALVIGRVPAPLHRFVAAYLRYQTHVFAFVTLMANPFPGFLGRPGSYPIDLEIDGPERQHRLKTLFRIFLAFPAFLVSYSLTVLLLVVTFLAWFAALGTGRMPTGFRNVGAWALRYNAQLNGYLYLLTDRYPYSGPEFAADDPPPLETEPVTLAA